MNDEKLLTKAELKDAVPFQSERQVDTLARKRKIPFVKLGYRTHRFQLSKVRAALEKLTVKEIGG